LFGTWSCPCDGGGGDRRAHANLEEIRRWGRSGPSSASWISPARDVAAANRTQVPVPGPGTGRRETGVGRRGGGRWEMGDGSGEVGDGIWEMGDGGGEVGGGSGEMGAEGIIPEAVGPAATSQSDAPSGSALSSPRSARTCIARAWVSAGARAGKRHGHSEGPVSAKRSRSAVGSDCPLNRRRRCRSPTI